MKMVLKKSMLGVGVGCTIFVLINIIGATIIGDKFLPSSTGEFVKSGICSMIVGVGFYLPTLIYDNEKLSRVMQSVIQMGIGFVIYFAAAFVAGWIRPDYGGWVATLISIAIAIFFSFAIWSGFYLFYYKNETKKINQKIKEMQEK